MDTLHRCITSFAIVYGAQYILSKWASPSPAENSTVGKKEHSLYSEHTRRIQHFATGLLIAVLRLFFVPCPSAHQILFVSSAILYSLHLLRLVFPKLRQHLKDSFSELLRPDEVNGKCPGAFYFLLGTGASFWLFSPHVGVLALLHLSVGDPMAAMTAGGFRYSNGKSFGGFVGCALACSAVTVIFCYLTARYEFLDEFAVDGIEGMKVVVYSIVGGIITAGVEIGFLEMLGWPLGKVDDNFTIPVIGGFALSKLGESLVLSSQ